MKENREVTDTNVGDLENSIEEAIERLEYIDRTYSCNNYYSIWDLKCIEILLSDYKRVLKENEELLEVKVSASAHNRILKLEKENKELKLYNNSITSELEQMTTEKFKNGWFHQSEFKGLIPVQKVKDKIEHYQKLQDNYIEKYDEINEGLQAMINALQELLEGRK